MNTKFKVLATAALLSISLSGIAQGIVSSQTLVREVKPSEPKKRYVSYRGSIEVSGIFSSAISGARFAIVPLGFQCSPYFYIGLGVGIQTLSLGDVDTPEEYLDGNQNKTYQGTYLDEEVTTPSLFLTSKVNIPTLSFGNEKRFIPFASVSVGSTFSDEGIMGDFRIGLTYMSKKKHSGVSVFLGLSTLPFEVEHVYSYKSGYSYTIGDYITNRSTCFNIGLSWEFGGAAGFNKRSRK